MFWVLLFYLCDLPPTITPDNRELPVISFPRLVNVAHFFGTGCEQHIWVLCDDSCIAHGEGDCYSVELH
jgi:hypothetical protein